MKKNSKNEKSENAGAAVLPNPKEASMALEARHSKAIRGCCQRIIDKVVETGRLYLDLCLYIRKNCVPPKQVAVVMDGMGFNRQVISRVNKVANASDELFSQFEARTIGFNKVLELSRGGAVAGSLAAEMGTDVTDVKAQIEEMESEASEAEPAAGKVVDLTDEEKKEKDMKRFERAAAVVLSVAATYGWTRQKKVVGGNGYILTVTKDKKFKPAAPAQNEA